MRILVLCGHRHHAGGVERYLEGVVTGLVAAGHEVAMLALRVGPEARGPIALPASVPAWIVEHAPADALRAALAWKPQVAYVHGVEGEDTVAAVQAALPTVLFVHEYGGCCISGFKTWQSVPRTCSRPLGPGCLAHFYPHRCGGLNPVTALRSYRVQRRRQDILRGFTAVVAGSRAMLAEMHRQGVAADRTRFVPYYVPEVEARLRAPAPAPVRAPAFDDPAARLLFVGRADRLKGGAQLLDALPLVADRLGRPVHLDVGGDGPDLDDWRAQAARVEARSGGRVAATFHGWVGGDRLDRLWQESALLVVPSIWPEPFGLVGPEAGVRGMPAAAYAVGGIPEWLSDGENGHLASGGGALAAPALADAIARALASEAHWRRLADGARRLAGRFRLAPHLAALEDAFVGAAGAPVQAPAATA